MFWFFVLFFFVKSCRNCGYYCGKYWYHKACLQAAAHYILTYLPGCPGEQMTGMKRHLRALGKISPFGILIFTHFYKGPVHAGVRRAAWLLDQSIDGSLGSCMLR